MRMGKIKKKAISIGGYDRMKHKSGMDRARWLESVIKDFVNHSPDNTLKNKAHDPAWAEPLVGFSNGADPLYDFLKKDIGPFYWTPAELFRLTFPDLQFSPGELAVISWILPQTKKTKTENRKETVFPAESWVRARVYGEEFNIALARHVVHTLEDSGYKAVAPSLSPHWSGKDSKCYGFASSWSERHTAHISGLGTFGICDGLITPKGKAIRCGSVVTAIDIPPTPRQYKGHHDFCLFYTKGKCGLCIKRCPAGAVTEAGHDKIKCLKFLAEVSTLSASRFGFGGYGCGLCQTGVPCESGIPADE